MYLEKVSIAFLLLSLSVASAAVPQIQEVDGPEGVDKGQEADYFVKVWNENGTYPGAKVLIKNDGKVLSSFSQNQGFEPQSGRGFTTSIELPDSIEDKYIIDVLIKNESLEETYDKESIEVEVGSLADPNKDAEIIEYERNYPNKTGENLRLNATIRNTGPEPFKGSLELSLKQAPDKVEMKLGHPIPPNRPHNYTGLVQTLYPISFVNGSNPMSLRLKSEHGIILDSRNFTLDLGSKEVDEGRNQEPEDETVQNSTNSSISDTNTTKKLDQNSSSTAEQDNESIRKESENVSVENQNSSDLRGFKGEEKSEEGSQDRQRLLNTIVTSINRLFDF